MGEQPARLEVAACAEAHDEFVAAEAARDAGRRQRRRDALRGVAQHAVAADVAEALVDALEVVEVDDREDDPRGVALEQRLHRVRERHARQQAGERVAARAEHAAAAARDAVVHDGRDIRRQHRRRHTFDAGREQCRGRSTAVVERDDRQLDVLFVLADDACELDATFDFGRPEDDRIGRVLVGQAHELVARGGEAQAEVVHGECVAPLAPRGPVRHEQDGRGRAPAAARELPFDHAQQQRRIRACRQHEVDAERGERDALRIAAALAERDHVHRRPVRAELGEALREPLHALRHRIERDDHEMAGRGRACFAHLFQGTYGIAADREQRLQPRQRFRAGRTEPDGGRSRGAPGTVVRVRA